MYFTRLRTHFQQNRNFQSGIILVLVCIAAYALLIPWLGFYGDDWGYVWMLYKHGTLEPFLRHTRVGFIPVYDALKNVIGPFPWMWQLYMIFLRWVCGMGFWLVLHKCWPEKYRYTLFAAVLFVVYPGFMLHYAAVNLSAFFLLLGSFLFSIWFNIRFLEGSRWRWVYLFVGLILSLINLTMAEYFYFMELVRPLILILYLNRQSKFSATTLHKMLPAWMPYLILFGITLLWRVISQSEINAFYSLKLLDALKENFFPSILIQLRQIALDIWNAGPYAYAHALIPLDFFQTRNRIQLAGYIALILTLTSVLFWVFRKYIPTFDRVSPRTSIIWILLGIGWSFLSGWAIWLAQLHFYGDFTSSRFTLPFMPGSVLILLGIISLFSRWKRVETFLFLLTVSGSILFQNLVANEYRRDWSNQNFFFHQLTWRFPDLEPGTMVILSDNPMKYGEENSLSAALNWIYNTAPGLDLDYYVYFLPGKYDNDIPPLQPGETKLKGHLVGQFNASYEKMVVLQFDQRGCFRTLYPNLDSTNGKYSEFIRRQTALSHPESVLRSAVLAPYNKIRSTFGKPPEEGWCWRYQQADRLAQSQDWQQIVDSSTDIKPVEYSHDKQKLMVFIQAYLEIGDTAKAESILQEIQFVDNGFRRPFCLLSQAWKDLYLPESGFAQTLLIKQSQAGCK